MSNKKFILNADDFGMSNAFNKAVLNGHNNGFLASASLCANGKAFNSAVHEILPECPNLRVGVHLNLIEEKSLLSGKRFNNGFVSLMIKSLSKKFLKEIEAEFRLQIEKVQSHTKVSHLDSHVHVHAIWPIFEIVCKLAQEYGVPYVRTQFEEFYVVPEIKKSLNLGFLVNTVKVGLLNFLSAKNKKTIKKYNLQTNDFLVGVGYTGMMDETTLEWGLKKIVKTTDGEVLVESLIHPCCFADNKNPRKIEFDITQNFDLKDKIERMGFEIIEF